MNYQRKIIELLNSKLKLSLFLSFALLVSCTKHKDDILHFYPEEADWGSQSWQYGESTDKNTTAVIEAHFAEFAQDSDNWYFNVTVNLYSGTECQTYEKRVDSNSPFVTDRWHKEWVLIDTQDKSKPLHACPPPSSQPAVISNSLLLGIENGENEDLMKYGSYISLPLKSGYTPKIPATDNLGTRSLMVFNLHTGAAVNEPIGAIKDIEKKSFNGIFIQKGFLEGRARKNTLDNNPTISMEIQKIKLDEVDTVFSYRQCLMAKAIGDIDAAHILGFKPTAAESDSIFYKLFNDSLNAKEKCNAKPY